jgi:signal transduction histidine kinase
MFVVFIGFTVSIFLLIAMAIKVFLPHYYITKTMEEIKAHTEEIRRNYSNLSEEEILESFYQLQNTLGGDVYFVDEEGLVKGSGNNKKTEGSAYISDETIFESTFMNRMGIEIFLFGVNTETDTIIYEVSIPSLDGAVNTMMPFLLGLLFVSLLIAMVVAYIISITITKPIKNLNYLAKRMKNKEVLSLKVVKKADEIGELNESIVLLYEELLSNIAYLETEFKKERAIESMKKQFLAQATHELKTPLAIIQGYAELVNDKIYEDEEEHDQFIQNIYNETERMSQLITDVLDYSKMENGFFTINKEETFIHPWLGEMMATFRPIVESKGLIFNANCHVEDLCIAIDALRMEQAVKNLLSNALEHSNQWITVNAYSLNQQLVLEVINSGDPISQADMPFIFDSFYKKKGKKKGTGLGLAIVKGIVEMHDGKYRVENIKNGVKFTLII